MTKSELVRVLDGYIEMFKPTVKEVQTFYDAYKGSALDCTPMLRQSNQANWCDAFCV